MNTTPSSTPRFTSTTAAERTFTLGGISGERALVLGGGGSAGNAWLIGVIAGLFDAGLNVTEARGWHGAVRYRLPSRVSALATPGWCPVDRSYAAA
jgi:hypothetical protein